MPVYLNANTVAYIKDGTALGNLSGVEYVVLTDYASSGFVLPTTEGVLVRIRNIDASIATTITAAPKPTDGTASLIDGAATFTLNAGVYAHFFCNQDLNWYQIG